VPGGTQANRRFVDEHVDWGTLSESERLVLADAQTSGGLLVALPEDRVAGFLAACERERTLARAVLGRVEAASSTRAAGSIAIRGRLTGVPA
jgi:selenide,water dikinase